MPILERVSQSPVSAKLTATQRRILALMYRNGGTAVFNLVPKRGVFRCVEHGTFVVFGLYQTPEFFLRVRGYIERLDCQTVWFGLTATGKRVALWCSMRERS